MRVSVYAPLCDYLLECKTETMILSFREIEKITNWTLPDSAYKHHSAWWSNHESHTQARNGWMAAGWCVRHVNLQDLVVQFNRDGGRN